MSIINPNSINGSFPVFGQDNPTQGFRDNFTNIKNNFVATKAEIEDLQNKVLLKTALNGIDFSNDMNGGALVNSQLKAYTQTFLGLGQQFGDVTINFLDGNFQFMETGSDITLTIQNWPSTTVTQPAYATLRLWFQVSATNGTPHTITFPMEVNINSSTIQGMNDVTKTVTFPEGGNYIFDLSTVNGGINIFISEVSRNRNNSGSDMLSVSQTNTGTDTYVNPISDLPALDLYKQVQYLDAGSSSSNVYYYLADGQEGQIMYFAAKESTNMNNIIIYCDNMRYRNTSSIVTNGDWFPFNDGLSGNGRTMATGIFVNGAWNFDNGAVD